MRPLIAAIVLALAAPGLTFAQTPVDHPQLVPDDGPPAPSLIACSYNAAGDYTGADTPNPGEQAGPPVQVAQGGDNAWRWVVAAKDGTECPRHIPS